MATIKGKIKAAYNKNLPIYRMEDDVKPRRNPIRAVPRPTPGNPRTESGLRAREQPVLKRTPGTFRGGIKRIGRLERSLAKSNKNRMRKIDYQGFNTDRPLAGVFRASANEAKRSSILKNVRRIKRLLR